MLSFCISYWDSIKVPYFADTIERGDRGWKEAQRGSHGDFQENSNCVDCTLHLNHQKNLYIMAFHIMDFHIMNFHNALAPTYYYYYSHSYHDSSVMAPISKWWMHFLIGSEDETQFTTKYPRTGWNSVYHQIPKTGWNSVYQILGYLGHWQKISHIQDGFAYNFSSPNHKHQNWYIVEGGGDYHLKTDELEQICVPPFLSLLDGLVLLINKT